MPDPRNNLFSVKPCPPSYSGKSAAQVGSSGNDRRNFGNAIGKIGDIQALNFSPLTSKIGQGLRTVASISNSIRTGCGALPTFIGDSIDKGANWVLNNMNIDDKLVDAVRQFNPQIANQAYGQAKAVYERVKQGGFKLTDIPSYLQDFQNLERLGRNIFSPENWTERNRSLSKVCEASPYAVDLILRAPKTKFLFIVEFIFEDPYKSLANLEFPFVVYKTTRPNIKFEMEDVNYYNFRSHVITKTKFEEMQMSFYDDNSNSVMSFVTAYLRASSPVANKETIEEMSTATDDGMSFSGGSTQSPRSTLSAVSQQFSNVATNAQSLANRASAFGLTQPASAISSATNTINSAAAGVNSAISNASSRVQELTGLSLFRAGSTGNESVEANSGVFSSRYVSSETSAVESFNSDAAISTPYYTASRGPFAGDKTQPIRAIKLYHVYEYGRFANVFTFMNPRITALDLDELDMSSSEPCMVQINFNYDSVFVATGVSADSIHIEDKTGGTRGMVYPLRVNATAAAAGVNRNSGFSSQSPTNPAACGPAKTTKTNTTPPSNQ